MNETATLTTGWEPDTPLDDSIVRQVVFAYADRVAWMARATGGRVDRDHAACIADVGSAFGYDNAAVLLQPPDAAGLAGVLARADRLFAPERWWIVLSAWPLPRDLPEGIALVGHPPLMLRPPGPLRVAQPAGLRICCVEDRQALVDFDAVLKAGFPLPGGAGVADRRLLGHDLRLLVGYDGDQPVATAGACTTGSLMEVDWVATLPSHRHRGIGAAMTAAAASTDPARPAVLFASDDGHDLYRGLGFIDLLRFTIWEHTPVNRHER